MARGGGGRHGGGYLFVGGQHNKASADERAGVWAVRTGVWFKHDWRGAAAASPEWLLDGHHPGCVERRRLLVAYMLPGVCEFDGRLSVVRHPTTGRYMMHARANAAAHGARFVMVATSADLVVWSPFQLLQIGGYRTPSQGDVYFWAAAVNPAAPTTLLAVFPIVDRLRGCLALSASRDGALVAAGAAAAVSGLRRAYRAPPRRRHRRPRRRHLALRPRERPRRGGRQGERADPLAVQVPAPAAAEAQRYAIGREALRRWTEGALAQI